MAVKAPSNRARLTLAEAPAATYVVGDVHGEVRLFDELETLIREDAAKAAPDAPILLVAVGDVIDRGPASASMLDRLVERTNDGLERISLLGNHEAMFLEFLEAPDGKAPWLRYGGRETLMSYGMSPDPVLGFDLSSRALRQLVDSHVPASHVELLRSMPVSLRLPGYLICHAGVNPTAQLARQSDDDLIWGNPHDLDSAPFNSAAVVDLITHRLMVVHGHVPERRAEKWDRRIGVDTGAYATGRLSAVRLSPNQEPVFLHVGGGDGQDVEAEDLALDKG
ncbi:MAG: metallophosphoesterase [Pseudomonadota bacterium]